MTRAPLVIAAALAVIAWSPASGQEARPAKIRVLCVFDATIELNGEKLPGKGKVRPFPTPPLEPGKKYSYIFKATWSDDGQQVSREEWVHFEAGQEITVDLRPAGMAETDPDSAESAAGTGGLLRALTIVLAAMVAACILAQTIVFLPRRSRTDVPGLTAVVPLSPRRMLLLVIGLAGGLMALLGALGAAFLGERANVIVVLAALVLLGFLIARAVQLLTRRQRLVFGSAALRMLRGQDRVVGQVPYQNIAGTGVSAIGLLGIHLHNWQDPESYWEGGKKEIRAAQGLYHCDIIIHNLYEEPTASLSERINAMQQFAQAETAWVCSYCGQPAQAQWLVLRGRKVIAEHNTCQGHSDHFIGQYFQRQDPPQLAPASLGDWRLVDLELMVLSDVYTALPIYLREAGGQRRLSIHTGQVESSDLASTVKGTPFPRPRTHEGWLATIQALGCRVECAAVVKCENDMFFATLRLDQAGQTVEVDLRPSDAFQLALLAGKPIYVAEFVLAQVGDVPKVLP